MTQKYKINFKSTFAPNYQITIYISNPHFQSPITPIPIPNLKNINKFK